SGRRISPLIMTSMKITQAMPEASTPTTSAVKPGLSASARSAWRSSWNSAVMTSPRSFVSCRLLVTQRFDRIHARRATRRKPARGERRRGKEGDDDDQRQRIDDADAEQLRLDQLRQRERPDQADAEADAGQARTVGQHEAQDVGLARADRHAHAEFAGAAGDGIGRHAGGA